MLGCGWDYCEIADRTAGRIAGRTADGIADGIAGRIAVDLWCNYGRAAVGGHGGIVGEEMLETPIYI